MPEYTAFFENKFERILLFSVSDSLHFDVDPDPNYNLFFLTFFWKS